MKINSYFPNDVHSLCLKNIIVNLYKLVRIAYFQGQKKYAETDKPDPTDLYGRSKFLGETDPQEFVSSKNIHNRKRDRDKKKSLRMVSLPKRMLWL